MLVFPSPAICGVLSPIDCRTRMLGDELQETTPLGFRSSTLVYRVSNPEENTGETEVFMVLRCQRAWEPILP
jgi:hypothetical protein